MERKEAQEILVNSMTSILTKEQQDDLKMLLSQMSDEEFFNTIECAKNKINKNVSLKDILNANKNLVTAKSRDFIKEASCSNIKTEFLSDDENKKAWEKIKNCSKPTDLIELNKDSIDLLIEMISPGKDELSYIPSDILFLDTIPIPDVIVNCKFSNGEGKFRVVIYPDYKKNIDSSDENNPAKIGAIILYINDSKFFIEIEILKGFDYIITSSDVGYHKVSTNVREYIIDKFPVADFLKSFSANLAIWYGLQISLLNPIIKDVFVKNTSMTVLKEPEHRNSKFTTNNSKKEKRKGKIRYIKRHIINADDINKRHNSQYERKTFSWYVIGHWRTYKNGHKVFIKPYWKGVLRNSKKYMDEPIRERELVVSDK